ncbi:MAG: RidA family protein [Burkholderiaceae bacterium]|nr:RidA family protein [Burkholderiaceae bacterium]
MARSLHLPQVGHRAPIPLGARVGPLLCSSAIAGKDPSDGSLPADGATQVAHAFANLRALLAAGGGGPEHVVKLAVTLADDGLRNVVNAQWLACYPDADQRPARHIAVQPLGHGQQVQLEVLAWIA